MTTTEHAGASGSDELRNSELLAALVESSEDAIIAKNLKGIIQTWNRGAESLYGYEPAEIIGRSAAILIPAEHQDDENEILARIESGKRVEHFETTRVRKDGTRISVSLTVSPIFNPAGTIIGASHIARRITERTLMEAAAAQLAAIVESSDDAIVSKNLDGIILTWNAAAERLYGYTAEEIRWRPITILLPPDRAPEEVDILRRLRRGERIDHFETTRLRKDGRLIEVALTISPIRDRDGHIRGASHIARDITQRKLFQTQMLQAQKLESLGILAGGVAHDFNNLLVGILTNTSLLEGALAPGTTQARILTDVHSAAERAAALTRQLLAYAGKGRFVTEPVNLSKLVREISGLVQSSIPSKVEVRLDLQEGLPPIDGDAGQLQQVIMNLVINAAEAVGEQPGLVVVTSSVQDVDENYGRAVWGSGELQPGRYVSLEVHDNGCGMAPETLERIFDPFYTTKFAGRGLGLAAVLGIVRGHGGGLKVYSAPGKGSTFKVLFPVAKTAARQPVAPPSISELTGRGTVLVVDDEEIVRKAARYTLERYGYHVETASSGIEALSIFARLKGEVVLVLLDLTMPGMDGEETLEQLRTIAPNVSVLLSSGFNEVEAVRRFTGKGLAGFVQKPYTSMGLAAKVKAVLETRAQRAG